MFRTMRRSSQLLTDKENTEILVKGSVGVLGVIGDGGHPYCVPLHYVYLDGRVYFHCANEGHKLDAIRSNDKVSFCVIGKNIIETERYNIHFSSVVIFGRARVVTDERAKKIALDSFGNKYYPQFTAQNQQQLDEKLNRVCVVEITIEHMTGKGDIRNIKRRNRGES